MTISAHTVRSSTRRSRRWAVTSRNFKVSRRRARTKSPRSTKMSSTEHGVATADPAESSPQRLLDHYAGIFSALVRAVQVERGRAGQADTELRETLARWTEVARIARSLDPSIDAALPSDHNFTD